MIELSTAVVIALGRSPRDVTDERKRRIQIREVSGPTWRRSGAFPAGIKVLSLFFIDEVVKYRDYGRADTLGAHARVFDAEYRSQVDELLGCWRATRRRPGT